MKNLSIALGLILILAVAAQAQTIVEWQGNTSSSWTAPNNWGVGGPPANDTTTNIADFNLSSYSNPAFMPNAGTASVAGITIGSSNAAMTLSGTQLTLGGSGITIAGGAGALTIASNMVAALTQQWANNSSNLFSISGNVDISGVTLTLGGSGNTTFTGSIGNVGSAGNLIKSGAGTVTLAVANSYTGTTTVSAGILNVYASGTLGSGTAAVSVAGGAELLLTGVTITNPLIIGGEGISSGGNIVSSSTNILNGNIILDPSTSTAIHRIALNSTTLTINGNIAVYSAASSLTLQGNGIGVITGVISDVPGNHGNVTKSAIGGVSSWTFSGNNSYTGTTTISSGDIIADNTNALGIGGAITFAGGILAYTANSIGTDWSARIQNSGGAISINTNGQNITYASALASSNTGGLTKYGTGTLTLTGNNAFTGNVDFELGTLNVQTSTALGTSTTGPSANVTIGTSDGAALLQLQSTSGITITKNSFTLYGPGSGTSIGLENVSGANTLNSNITIIGSFERFAADSGSLTITGNIALDNGANDLILQGTVGTGTMSGIISGTGGSVTKSATTGNTGTWILSGNNTYTGETAIGLGTLLINGDQTLATGAVVFNAAGTLGGTGIIGGTVTLASGTVLRPGNVSSNGTLTLHGGLTTVSGSILGFHVSDGTTPATYTVTPGGSTIGTPPATSSNSFLHFTGGTISIVSGTKVQIDGTGATFQLNQPYSYQVADGYTGTAFDFTTQSNFSTIGFTANSFELVSSGSAIYLNFTSVPEPMLLVFAALLGFAFLPSALNVCG